MEEGNEERRRAPRIYKTIRMKIRRPNGWKEEGYKEGRENKKEEKNERRKENVLSRDEGVGG